MKWIAVILILIGFSFFMFIGKQEPKRVKTTHPHKEMVLSEVSKKEYKVVTREKKPVVSNIKIDLGEDIDTLIDTNVTINLNIKSLPKGFFLNWHLDNNSSILSTIPSLTKSFKEGEHLIKVQLYNSNGDIVSEDNLTIKAWRYKKIEKYEYSIKKDDFLLIEGKVLNYKNKILLLFDYIHSIKYTYNKFGKILEKEFQFFEKPENNYKLVYEYDEENGQTISEKRINESDGKEIVFFDLRDDNKINNDNKVQKKEDIKYAENIINYRYTKNGREFSYEETLFPDYKEIIKKEYDDNGRVILETIKKMNFNGTLKGELINSFEYNENGKIIQKETKEKEAGELKNYYIKKLHYENEVLKYEDVEAIVGNFSYFYNSSFYLIEDDIRIVKSKIVYGGYDTHGALVISKRFYQKEGDNELREIKPSFIKTSYTNTLEEDY